MTCHPRTHTGPEGEAVHGSEAEQWARAEASVEAWESEQSWFRQRSAAEERKDAARLRAMSAYATQAADDRQRREREAAARDGPTIQDGSDADDP